MYIAIATAALTMISTERVRILPSPQAVERGHRERTQQTSGESPRTISTELSKPWPISIDSSGGRHVAVTTYLDRSPDVIVGTSDVFQLSPLGAARGTRVPRDALMRFAERALQDPPAT